MPLHLLGKKSWNVYNSANISQVRADEAHAAKLEEEHDLLTQEQDALVRTALLRGEEAPVFAALPALPDSSKRPRREVDPSGGHVLSREERKELRRGRDEDESSHAIRLAALQAEKGQKTALAFKELGKQEDEGREVAITDHKGHIQLFAPPDEKEIRKGQKNSEVETEKKRKERELEDQVTMRFSNAAGYNKSADQKPWYAAAGASTTSGKPEDAAASQSLIEDKNVWGRPDPHRKDREEKRISSSDPFAFMQKAQGMLKQSEKDKEKWRQEKERELARLDRVEKYEREAQRKEREERRREKEERRRRRRMVEDEDDRRHGAHERGSGSSRRHEQGRAESVDSLEGFSLDAPAGVGGREREGKHGRRSGRDDKNRSNHHGHGRDERSRRRSRSRERDHERDRDHDRHRERDREETSHRSHHRETKHRRRSKSPRRV